MEGMRINKYLSDIGFCSRREGDRLIKSGRVTIDGRVAEVGCRVTGDELIEVDSQPVNVTTKKVVLAYYKEKGVVCSTVSQGEDDINIVERVNYPLRVYPIGRLDKDSEGLILLTNDGSLVNSLLKGEGGHEKEYEALLDKPVSDEVIAAMAAGGLELIPGRKTRPCRVERLGENSVRIVLIEGINRQIRRMCEEFGLKVVSLKRVRFLDLTLEGLKPGEYRELTEEEVEGLRQSAGL